MPKRSAGLLMYRRASRALEVAAGASGRAVLGEEGCRRLVDPEGRI